MIKVLNILSKEVLNLNAVFSLHNIYYRKLCMDYHFSPITYDMNKTQ